MLFPLRYSGVSNFESPVEDEIYKLHTNLVRQSSILNVRRSRVVL